MRVGDVEIMAGKAFKALVDGPNNIEGQVVSNLPYMIDLEYGSSTQAPTGMLRINLARIRQLTRVELQHALTLYSSPSVALEAAVTSSILGALRILAIATPVDTGRAKGSWRAILPDKRRLDASAVGVNKNTK